MKTLIKTKATIFTFFFICFATFNSCDKNKTNAEKQADIYVAGSQKVTGTEIATLWKNGVASNLTDVQSSATDLFISGNDVFVSGGQSLTTSVGKVASLWKNNNNEKIIFSRGSGNSHGQSVYVSGTDVYIGGYETIEGVLRATIWKNGKLFYTFPKNTISMIYHIAVQAQDVYITGFPVTEVGYWKTNGASSEFIKVSGLDWIHGLTVSGSDVYVTGKSEKKARFIKNGSPVNLTDGANAAFCSSVFISGSDVYAAGSEVEKVGGNYIAKYWKNGIPTSLTDGSNNGDVNSIFVWNTKVYIVGNDGKTPFLWKDGTFTKLSSDAKANSVAVMDRP